jgi:hypothetical protein
MVFLLTLDVPAWLVVPPLVVAAVWLMHTKHGVHQHRRC